MNMNVKKNVFRLCQELKEQVLDFQRVGPIKVEPQRVIVFKQTSVDQGPNPIPVPTVSM